MRTVLAALVALEYAAITQAASPPRGVGPEFAKYYEDAASFTCISNPAISISASRINDDFCDCPDGSDEPGTSACAHLSPYSPHTPADTVKNAVNTTAALPGFYCVNKGHIPSYVPFTNVNDGICDYDTCCDGSEEWEGIGGHKCKNKCDEIGKEWRKQDEVRQKSASNALKKRHELVQEAAKLRQQLKDRLQSLTTEREGAEIRVKELEKEFEETKRKEAGKVVKTSEGSKGGKLGQLVDIGRRRMDELRNLLIANRAELTFAREKLQNLEQIMSTFKEEYNPNFNDEGVKRAVRAWEDYIASNPPKETNAAEERDLDEIVKPDNENGLNWDDYNEGEEEETAVIYEFLNYLPPSLRTYLDTKLRDLRQSLIDGGILASPSGGPTAGESKKVTDARNRLEAAKKDVENHRKSFSEAEEDLNKDFGPDDVFRALKGTCVEKDSGEYTYEVCFLEKTTQKPKKGGGHTNMGKFVRMEKVIVDEEVGADGKGLGSGERIAMKYENGQHCWNGPNRSTTVILACSEENEVWKIMEEEKCVYRMEVGTPAVCEAVKRSAGAGAGAKGHDEL